MKFITLMPLVILVGCAKFTKFDINKAEKQCGSIDNITYVYKVQNVVSVKCDSKESEEIVK